MVTAKEKSELTLDQIKLFHPYRLSFQTREDNDFMLFMSKGKSPRVLEHNPRVNTVLIHNWRHEGRETYNLTEMKNFRSVIRSLFESRWFIE